MAPTPLLLIHAGMRPGEIIIAHADGSCAVFVPPTDHVHNFIVGKNQTKEEWAILRHYSDTVPPDALISFPSEGQALSALDELHKALLEPATAEEKRSWVPHILGGLLVLAIAFIVFRGADHNTSNPPLSTTSPPAQETPRNPLDGYIPDASSPVGELTPSSPPPAAPAMSPGDSLLHQIQGGSAAIDAPIQASPQQPPQQAPAQQATPPAAPAASPGDSLLQQIKGK